MNSASQRATSGIEFLRHDETKGSDRVKRVVCAASLHELNVGVQRC